MSGLEPTRERVNRHHFVYERWMYQTPTERSYRNLGQLVVPRMLIPVHDELHARVPTPPKPPLALLVWTLEHIATDGYDPVGTADNAEHLAEWYESVTRSAKLESTHKVAEKIAKNLRAQLPFIREGAV